MRIFKFPQQLLYIFSHLIRFICYAAIDPHSLTLNTLWYSTSLPNYFGEVRYFNMLSPPFNKESLLFCVLKIESEDWKPENIKFNIQYLRFGPYKSHFRRKREKKNGGIISLRKKKTGKIVPFSRHWIRRIRNNTRLRRAFWSRGILRHDDVWSFICHCLVFPYAAWT